MALSVNQTMDLTQAMQTLKWLDEERRKDKALIATLQERVQNQERQLAQQAAQIQELQDALSAVNSTMAKVTEFEQLVASYRDELILQMEQRDATRRRELAESDRLRRLEYEAVTTHLNRLEKDMRVLPRYDEEINGLRTENQRLGELIQGMTLEVADLRKRSDDRAQAVSYLEEQRRADNRRIVDLEKESSALRQRVEGLAAKLPLLEDSIKKQRARIEDAIQETKKYEKPIEELRISDFQREQKMRQYLEQGELVAKELERIRAQTQGFTEQQQLVKRSLATLEKFKTRIERRQDELAERQRMNEEQMQKRWEEWQAARLKEQKKQSVEIEERWRQQWQFNDSLTKRVDEIAPVLRTYRGQLEALWDTHRANAVAMLQASQDLYEAFTSPIKKQLEILRGEREE